MQVVVDTNVWVSAFLSPGGTPGRLLQEVKRKRLTLVYDTGIEAEYRAVLARSRFNLSPELVGAFLARLQEDGLRIDPTRVARLHLPTDLPDLSDVPFIVVTLAAGCPIVTGNTRHFPPDCGVEVLSPAACLERVCCR